MAEVFKVEGLKETEAALVGLADEFDLSRTTARNVIIRALKDAGEPVRSDAEARAPTQDDGGKPHLKPSIAISTKLSRRQKSEHKKESAVEVFIGAGPLPQAHLQEFGSSLHGAQPYLRPAWDSNRMAVLNSIVSSLHNQIEKTRKRLARKAERLAAKIKGAGI